MSLLDWIYIPVILFVAAVTLIASMLLLNEVNDAGLFPSGSAADVNFQQSRNTLLSMDNMMLFILVGLTIFVIVSAFFSYNHPVIFFLGIVVLIVALIIAASFSNTYETFSGQKDISNTSAMFPKTQFLMNHLPWYIVFGGFLTTIVMYVGYAYARGQ